MQEQFHAAEQDLQRQAPAAQAVKQAYQDQQDALSRINVLQRQITGNMEVQQDDAVGAWQATKIGANMLTGVFGTTGKAELEAAAKSFREITRRSCRCGRTRSRSTPRAWKT